MRRLSQGMEIDAAIEANLLGIRLLTLKAKITALPARHQVRHAPVHGARHVRLSGAGGPVRHARLSGGPVRHACPSGTGNGLAAATKSLEAGAADLAAARRVTAHELGAASAPNGDRANGASSPAADTRL